MAEQEIRKKLDKALQEMQTPAKTGVLNYGGVSFNYATLDDIVNEIKAKLKKQGLTLQQGIECLHNDQEILGYVLNTGVSDGKDTIVLDQRPMTFGDAPQKVGATETYYRRYALNTAFCLAGEADTDGNAEVEAKQNNEELNELRKLYKQAKDAGIPQEVLDGTMKAYGKEVEDLTQDEINEIKACFQNGIENSKRDRKDKKNE